MHLSSIKWSVGKKIGSSFAFVLLILVVLGTISYLNITNLIESSSNAAKTQDVIIATEEFHDSLNTSILGASGYLATNGEEFYLDEYNNNAPQINRRLDEIKDYVSSDQERLSRIEKIQALTNVKLNELNQEISLASQGNFVAATNLIGSEESERTAAEIQSEIDAFISSEHDNGEVLLKSATSDGNLSKNFVLYGIPLAMLLVFGLAYYLTRNISSPLINLTKAASDISKGDLTVEVPERKRSDEVGELSGSFRNMIQYLQAISDIAMKIGDGELEIEIEPVTEKDVLGEAFKKMVANLKGTIRELLQAIEVLAEASQEIMQTTEETASGAQETATAIGETTTTIEQVRQTANVSADKARAMSAAAEESGSISQEGNKAAGLSLGSMNRIQEQMRSVAESVVQMSEQSQAIGKIISSVNDLAEQSNLLAVNASIEAAKAADQGRGFAVVAQEIKSLADQSKRATAQVRDILTDIQKATNESVLSTEQSTNAVEEGVKVTRDAGKAIELLAAKVTVVGDASSTLAASNEQQLIGMDQISAAMEDIKKASEKNVDNTRKQEETAQRLHELGSSLKSIASYYKVA